MSWRRGAALLIRVPAAVLLILVGWPATAAGEWLVAWSREVEHPGSVWDAER